VRHGLDLVVQLVRDEFQVRYRRALFGWLWAVAQPLLRLAVLSFVFTQLVPLGVPDYPVFLFSGLLVWSWFASGVVSVTASAVQRQDLLLRPGVTRLAGPLAAVLTDLLDLLAALPVLLVFLLLGPGIPWTALLLPVLLLAVLALILGVGLLCCAVNVRLRDAQQVVSFGVLLGFYLTPVFYQVETLPENLQSLLALNPMTSAVVASRSLLLEGRLPELGTVTGIVLPAVVSLMAGLWVYDRTSRTFVDHL